MSRTLRRRRDRLPAPTRISDAVRALRGDRDPDPVHPQMLDVMSMCQFLIMTSDLLAVVAKAGGNMNYDWMRYLVTRYEPGDGPQAPNGRLHALAVRRSHAVTNTMLKSTAISDAGITKQTLYEVSRDQFTRATYDRAMESLDSVNGEIQSLIQAAWGRT